jgi:hypothetical protein
MDPRTMDVNHEEHEEADLNQKKDFTTESTESTEGRDLRLGGSWAKNIMPMTMRGGPCPRLIL